MQKHVCYQTWQIRKTMCLQFSSDDKYETCYFLPDQFLRCVYEGTVNSLSVYIKVNARPVHFISCGILHFVFRVKSTHCFINKEVIWQLDEVCPLRQLYSFSVNVEEELYYSIERQVVKKNNLIITINRTNCAQQILSFKTNFQIRKGRQTAITFVEFQKAYDSINT